MLRKKQVVVLTLMFSLLWLGQSNAVLAKKCAMTCNEMLKAPVFKEYYFNKKNKTLVTDWLKKNGHCTDDKKKCLAIKACPTYIHPFRGYWGRKLIAGLKSHKACGKKNVPSPHKCAMTCSDALKASVLKEYYFNKKNKTFVADWLKKNGHCTDNKKKCLAIKACPTYIHPFRGHWGRKLIAGLQSHGVCKGKASSKKPAKPTNTALSQFTAVPERVINGYLLAGKKTKTLEACATHCLTTKGCKAFRWAKGYNDKCSTFSTKDPKRFMKKGKEYTLYTLK